MKRKKKVFYNIQDMQNKILANKDTIWCPNNNVICNNDRINKTWFSIKESDQSNHNYIRSSFIKNDLDKIKFSSKKIVLKLNNDQKIIIDKWLKAYKEMYNHTLKDIKNNRRQNNEKEITDKYKQHKKQENKIKELAQKYTVNCHDVRKAINLVCQNYKTNLKLVNCGKKDRFRMRYWSDDKLKKSMNIVLPSFSNGGEYGSIKQKLLGTVKGYYEKERFNFKTIDSDCVLQKDGINYYLYVPCKAETTVERKLSIIDKKIENIKKNNKIIRKEERKKWKNEFEEGMKTHFDEKLSKKINNMKDKNEKKKIAEKTNETRKEIKKREKKNKKIEERMKKKEKIIKEKIKNEKDYLLLEQMSELKKGQMVQKNKASKKMRRMRKKIIKKDKNRVKKDQISIDLGIRTFGTCITDKSMVQIGTECQDKIEHYLTRLDKIMFNPDINSKLKKKNKKMINNKIRNLVEELHWKTINYLTENYKNVIVGDISSQSILKSKDLPEMIKRICSALSFYKFKQRLAYKCSLNGVNLSLINEYNTSKVCSMCGNVHPNLGASEIYNCVNCRVVMNRDVNGARNIHIRARE